MYHVIWEKEEERKRAKRKFYSSLQQGQHCYHTIYTFTSLAASANSALLSPSPSPISLETVSIKILTPSLECSLPSSCPTRSNSALILFYLMELLKEHHLDNSQTMFIKQQNCVLRTSSESLPITHDSHASPVFSGNTHINHLLKICVYPVKPLR